MSDPESLLSSRIGALGLGVPELGTSVRNSLGQEQFFELMVAQLKNQDPLSPMESNEFLTQLAQFASVNGINSVEQSINDLSATMQSTQALQASALVGREVLVPTSVGQLEAGGEVSGAVSLAASTGELTLYVSDPSGRLVREIPLGARDAGNASFTWDGLHQDGTAATPGRYVFEAIASTGNATEAAPVLMRSQVDSVTLSRNPTGVILNVRGVGAVDVNEIRELL